MTKSLPSSSLFTRVKVAIALKDRIVGGIPQDPKMIEGWIGAKMPELKAEEKADLAARTAAELPAATEEAAKSMWTTFKRDETGLYLEGRNVKALLKEVSNILRDKLLKGEAKELEAASSKAKNRFTNLKSKVAERAFVEEDKIRFTRGDQVLKAVDGTEERPIHVITAQGPRTALKRFDYVNAPAELTFHVRFLSDGVVDLKLLETIFEYGGWNGLGADRSQGNGQFTVASIETV